VATILAIKDGIRREGATLMRVIDVALDAALLVMRNGGSTVAADRTFLNVLKGCEKGGVTAVWRLDFVATSAEAPIECSAVVRPVGTTGVNLSRVSAAMHLAERLAKRRFAVAEFAAELERVKTLPSPYSRQVTIAAAACAAGAFSQVAGGDWGSLAIAAAAAAAGQLLRPLLQANGRPVALVTLACGVLSALVAAVGVRLNYSQTAAATLIASVIYMVPGLPLINGFIDMTSQKYLLVGMERGLNAAFLFLVLAISIAMAIALTRIL
jgi:uncharacterized membrane protein YjjP (DUF1212 family)